jgi:putative endonuclease
MPKSVLPWVTYILECADGTLYVGSTTDIERRLIEHNTSEKGARYTKTRRPVMLKYIQAHTSRSEAQKQEAALKAMGRKSKLALISSLW